MHLSGDIPSLAGDIPSLVGDIHWKESPQMITCPQLELRTYGLHVFLPLLE